MNLGMSFKMPMVRQNRAVGKQGWVFKRVYRNKLINNATCVEEKARQMDSTKR